MLKALIVYKSSLIAALCHQFIEVQNEMCLYESQKTEKKSQQDSDIQKRNTTVRFEITSQVNSIGRFESLSSYLIHSFTVLFFCKL